MPQPVYPRHRTPPSLAPPELRGADHPEDSRTEAFAHLEPCLEGLASDSLAPMLDHPDPPAHLCVDVSEGVSEGAGLLRPYSRGAGCLSNDEGSLPFSPRRRGSHAQEDVSAGSSARGA